MIIYQSDIICFVCTEEQEAELHELYFASGKFDRTLFDRVISNGIVEISVKNKMHLSSINDNVYYDCCPPEKSRN